MNFTLEEAKKLDQKDPLKSFRAKFHFPKTKGGKPVLYFCGNSLGLQPVGTKKWIQQELNEWAKWGVEGHFHAKSPWLPYHEVVTKSLARLVGGKTHEVVAMNGLTSNLHLLFASFYRPQGARDQILIENQSFPSDEYAVKSQIQWHGKEPAQCLLKADHSTEAIISAIEKAGSRLVLVWIGQPNYLSGTAFDLKRIAEAAHKVGALLGVDLAHGVGNLQLALHADGVDFATWCSYKYLNSGPGGISGIFVHERHGLNPSQHRLAGWWGHDKTSRFKMGPDFQPIPGAEGWQLSNPPIFQLAALRASLEVFDAAGIDRLRTKSKKISSFLALGIQQETPEIQILTPLDPDQRGTQLSLRFPAASQKKKGKHLTEALIKEGLICDFREPDIIRLAPAPLYTRYQDCIEVVRILKKQVIQS